MRMHPRLKARRGRFGPGGLSGPVLRIVSPASGSVFGPGSPGAIPNFVGTASDDLDGNISANIEWTVQGPGSPGVITFGSPTLATGASVDLDAALVGPGSPQGGLGSPGLGSPQLSSFRVIARVADSGGSVRTAAITITVVTGQN